jgi:hypothetical protein
MMVVVISPPCMVVRLVSTGMAVRKAMRMPMDVLVWMVVLHHVMVVGMGVKMPVKMAVLVLMLQGPDGLPAALPERIRQAVEITQPGVLEKGLGGLVLANRALMHDHRPA